MTTYHKPENIIMWQKWFDPFGEDDKQELINQLKKDTEDNQDDDVMYDGDEEKHETSFLAYNKKNIKVIATPMGIIPLTENTASSKIFNFWVGHTNFNITETVANIIEVTPGVETLDIFTRYRFRIGIGKAFKDSDVMTRINNSVYEYLE